MDWKRDWSEWFKQTGIELPKGVYPKVIFEGSDATGKSTIQNILMDIMKHTFLLHTSAPPKGLGREYYENLLTKGLEFSQYLNQPFIADRFHIGESVYGSIFRGYNFSEEFRLNVEQQLLKQGFKIVYVHAEQSVVERRLKERGDWYVKTEDTQHILSRYEEELSKTLLPVFKLDTTNDIWPSDIENLIKFVYGLE